ncbi:hypothetical protein [Endobacterium cereale]|uniref:hypothetical protein n=1 Tax=Endobacterium cereale TaxID=2663029 RepID=UPI002B45A651|nr:hypothetical protein [Endobacterium cereale]MEB2848031.1 hypothetical protein [Endobacterium cereale]
MQAYRDVGGTRDKVLSDAEVLEAAASLVDDFLGLVRDLGIGQDIEDECVLPASRLSLENAFRLEIATTMSPDRRSRLVASGKLLAQFQPNVGNRINLSPASGMGQKARMNSAHANKIEAILDRADTDRVRMSALFANSESIAKRRFESRARPPFHADGTYAWYGHRTDQFTECGQPT